MPCFIALPLLANISFPTIPNEHVLIWCSLTTKGQAYGIADQTVAPLTGSAYSILEKATPKAANSGPSTSIAASISG